MEHPAAATQQTSRTDMAATIIPSPTIPNSTTGLLLSHTPGVFVAALWSVWPGSVWADEYVCTSIGVTTAAALGVTAEMDCGHMSATRADQQYLQAAQSEFRFHS